MVTKSFSKIDIKMKITQLFLAALITVIVSGCGGGGTEDGFVYIPPSFGSIAINSVTGAAGISANYSSQNEANNAALGQCGVINCQTAIQFGSNMCGALARATNGVIFGWATNSSSAGAKANSITQCINRNGVGCAVVLDQCNSS